MKQPIAALVLGMVLTGALAAQPPGPPGPMTFSELDRNADGAVTEQEFLTARAERMAERARQGYAMRNLANAPTFTALDADGNGRMTPDEYAAARARHGPPMMSRP